MDNFRASKNTLGVHFTWLYVPDKGKKNKINTLMLDA